MKKLTAIILTLIALTLTFTSCVSTEVDGEITVGVIQYMSHPSLDNCYEGVEAALRDTFGDKIKIDRQIGSANSADSDCASYADNMVAKGYDIIIPIATPAATSAFAATEGTDIPVVFCAVSDPVAVKLVESLEAPGYNCTGTSDVLDLEAQLDLIQSIQPDVKTIGILYTSSEANSITNLTNFKAIADKIGLTVDAVGVQSPSDIPAAATALVERVDCLNNFTDNNVVNSLSVVLDAANAVGIPVYGSEEEQVKNGCLASVSIDYVALGRVTGEMAAEVLNGKDASTVSVRTISDTTPIFNEETAKKLGLEIPEN